MALKEKNMEPSEIEFISIYDVEMEWDSVDQTEHFMKLYEEALTSEGVLFDVFHAYEAS